MPPIYEFQCPNCKVIKEELSSMNAKHSVEPCNGCKEVMVRVMSASVGRVQAGTPKLTNTLRDKNVS